MAIASSRELRPAPHKEQESIPTAYSQKEAGQSIPQFLSVFQKVKGMNKKAPYIFALTKKNVSEVRQALGPEILQGNNEKEAVK